MALVDKVERPAVGHEHAHHAPFQHLVEIAGPGLVLEAERSRCGVGLRLLLRSGRQGERQRCERSDNQCRARAAVGHFISSARRWTSGHRWSSRNGGWSRSELLSYVLVGIGRLAVALLLLALRQLDLLPWWRLVR